jgi:hypothetical protein
MACFFECFGVFVEGLDCGLFENNCRVLCRFHGLRLTLLAVPKSSWTDGRNAETLRF